MASWGSRLPADDAPAGRSSLSRRRRRCAVHTVRVRVGASYAKGLDVSHYQGAIDWIQVAAATRTVTFAKATEGTTLVDPTYAINRAGANSLGLKLGAYHFGRPAGSGAAGIAANAIAQADFFVSIAQPAAATCRRCSTSRRREPRHRRPRAMDAGLAGRTLRAHRHRRRRLRLAGLLEDGRSATPPRSPGDGHPLWIAHWTDERGADSACTELGRLRLDVLAVDGLPTVPGFAPLRRRRPLRRSTRGRSRCHRTRPGRLARASRRPSSGPRSRREARRRAGLVWTGGKPVSFTYLWQSCDAAGFLRARPSPARRSRRTRRPRPTSATRSC